MLSTPGLEILSWGGFFLLIGMLLALDLGIFHKKSKAVSIKEALFWSCFWICLSLLFNLLVLFMQGKESALQFFTGYLVEKSLSLDNLFVFALIFGYFKIPDEYQYKVLYWGIIGAVVLRLILILAGVSLIAKFHWITYLLGAFLCITGIRLFVQKEKKLYPEKNLIVRLCMRFFPVTEQKGSAFFVRMKGVLYVTPLFIAHLMMESSDLVFALDSIPAIFAITSDPFIIFTSNIFAVLGLRSLYFLIVGSFKKFRLFKYGLSLILFFIGAKMVLEPWAFIPLGWSLLAIALILGLSLLASLWVPAKKSR